VTAAARVGEHILNECDWVPGECVHLFFDVFGLNISVYSNAAGFALVPHSKSAAIGCALEEWRVL
jgi:hypothetical protein